MSDRFGLLMLAALVGAGVAVAEPRGFIKSRSPASPKAATTKGYPADSEQGIMMALAKEIDGLKEKVDEWGTMSFSPLILVAPEVGPETPFALKENPAKDAQGLTFDKFYEDYNVTNGRSSSVERTQFTLRAAYGSSTDVAAQAVEAAKLETFQINQDRAVNAQIARQELAEKQFAEAGTRQQTAKTRADAAAAAVADASQKQALAVGAHTAAASRSAAASTADKPAAAAAEVEAKLAKDSADAALIRAQAEKTAADAELTAANTAFTLKETEYTNSLNTPLALAGSSSVVPTINAPNPLNGMNVAKGEGGDPNVTGVASPALENMGNNAMPSVLPAKDATAGAGSFPPLARINAAAAALTVKNIHTFLGNPDEVAKYKDRRIIFGVSTLSVNPGWRTKRDFKGVISAKLTTAQQPAHPETVRQVLNCADYPLSLRLRIAKENPGLLTAVQRTFYNSVTIPEMGQLECRRYFDNLNSYRTPKEEEPYDIMVTAVTPMVDAQNLDLASSVARQDEIALYLATSLSNLGASQAGKIFSSWTKMRRKDVATKSTLATANSTTFGGGAFGFEMGTRLRGLDDDDAKGNKAAQTLDRQTFPVLLMLGVRDEFAKPEFQLVGGRVLMKEPLIRVSYRTNWSRISPSKWRSFTGDRVPSDSYSDMMDIYSKSGKTLDDVAWAQSRVGERMSAAEKAGGWPTAEADQTRAGITQARSMINEDWEILLNQLMGTDFRLRFPAGWLFAENDMTGLRDTETVLQGSSVTFSPRHLAFPGPNQPITVVLEGKQFDLLDPARIAVIGEGISLDLNSVRALGSKAVSVNVSASKALPDGDFTLGIGYRNRLDHLVTGPVSYSVGNALPSVMNGFVDPGSPVSAAPDAEGKLKGKFQLVVQGEGLARLDHTNLKVIGEGIDSTSSKVFLGTGNESATVVVDLVTTRSSGSASLSADILDPPSAGTIRSQPFTYTFIDPTPPAVDPWAQPEYLTAADTTTTGTGKDAKVTYAGSFNLGLTGKGFDRLDLTRAKLFVDGKPTAAKVIPGKSYQDSAILTVAVTDWAALEKVVYLQLPFKHQEVGVFTAPVLFKLVPKP